MAVRFKVGLDVWTPPGQRVGLISHAAARDAAGRTAAERLHETPGVDLAALFGPEHGFWGGAGAGEAVAARPHPAWDIPVHSLYGERRRPDPDALRTLDRVVVDLQDLAVRCYTYASTLRLVLEACAEAGRPVTVLDRPVPFPSVVDGPMLDPACSSFVGMIPTPLVYGMTPGETARFLRETLNLRLDLEVVAMTGYRRPPRPPRGGPPWACPSPGIRSWESAWAYPATVWTEALPAFSCGRSTGDAFQVVSAAGLDGVALSEALRHRRLPGVAFSPWWAARPDGGFDGGIRLRILRPNAFRPVATAVHLIETIQGQLGPDAVWSAPDVRPEFFDKLFGTRSVREALQAGRPAAEIVDGWREGIQAFQAARRRSLIYPELGATDPGRSSHFRVGVPSPPSAPSPTGDAQSELGATDPGRSSHFRVGVPSPPPAPAPTENAQSELGATDPSRGSHFRVGVPPPSRAFVLAAGLGSRLDPLTRIVPKPLLPLAGRAMVDRVLDRMAAWGVAEAVVNVHHLAGQVMRHLIRRGGRPAITFSHEPRLLDTGGALRRAAPSLPRTDPFWLVNADADAEVEPGPFLDAWRNHEDPLAVLWMVPDRGPRTVRLGSGRILDFRSPEAGSSGHVTFSGWHLVSPRILDYIPEGASSIIQAYERALAAGERIVPVIIPGSVWHDIGTVDQYLDAVEAREGRRRALLPGASRTPGARPRNVVAAPGAVLLGPERGLVVPAGWVLSGPEAKALGDLGWPPERLTATPLSPRGSDRSFHRLRGVQGSCILCRWGRERPENRRYSGHARLLAGQGVPVPALLADDPRHQFSVWEDAGDEDLLHAVRGASRKEVGRLYAQAWEVMTRLHAARPGRRGLEPAFGPDLYRWEHDLFLDRLVRDRFLEPPSVARRLRRCLDRVAERLLLARTVLVHRDFQSTNLLVHGHGGGGDHGLVVIDFQGMRKGPAMYDAASLLCDPYVPLAPEVRGRLIGRLVPPSDLPAFWAAAVQRLAQALGAFGRLAARPETRRFAEHIGPALRLLAWAAAEVPEAGGLAEGAEQNED